MISKTPLFYSLGLGLICLMNDCLGAFRVPELPPGPIIIITRAPDLIVSDLEVIPDPNYDVAYRYTIKNIGDATADLNGPSDSTTDNVFIQAYVSTDAAYANGNDLPAGGDILVGTLAPGASLTKTFGAHVSFDPAVHRYLVLKVDPTNKMGERDENNNVSATRILYRPDLIVSGLEVIDDPAHDIAYRYTIQNIGNVAASLDGATRLPTDNVIIQAFVSEDAVYGNSGDMPAGGQMLGGTLAPGASLTLTFGATANFNPTVHRYLVLKVDASNELIELNEINNTRAARTRTRPCFPDLPQPILSLRGTEDAQGSGQPFTRYLLEVSNWAAFPDALFEPAPDLPPCGENTSSSRSWVSIYDGNGDYVYGFCAFGQASDLQSLWFSVPAGEPPPVSIYVEINDRQCGQVYRSPRISTGKLRIASVAGPERQIQLTIPECGSPLVLIQASVDLVNWETIDTAFALTGTIDFVDPAAAGMPMRFYRTVGTESE